MANILHFVVLAAAPVMILTLAAIDRHWKDKTFWLCWLGIVFTQIVFFAGFWLFDTVEDAYYRRIAAECLEHTASGGSFEKTEAFEILCRQLGSETEAQKFWEWFRSQPGEPYDFQLLVKLRGITDSYAYGFLPMFLGMMFVICFLWDLLLLGVWKFSKWFILSSGEDLPSADEKSVK